MASELSNPASLKRAFEMLDRDGDGELGCTDLLDFFRDCLHQNMKQEEAKAMIDAAVGGVHGKEAVTLADFRHLVESSDFGDAIKLVDTVQEPDTIALLWEIFYVLDVDKDGFLSPQDLREALSSNLGTFSEGCIDDMLDAARGNGIRVAASGTSIDFKSFAQLILSST
ncbi:hypothetical protein L7F22_064714 [Adiantum nelumboides]|nr:hypothetical protein [Adiantum nelumboides]